MGNLLAPIKHAQVTIFKTTVNIRTTEIDVQKCEKSLLVLFI